MRGLTVLVVALAICASARAADPPQVAALHKFYATQGNRPTDKNIRAAVLATIEAAHLLCLDKQVDTMLSQWTVESAYHPESKDADGKSEGIAQTINGNRKQWKAFWKRRHVTLGPFAEVRTQVFYGVAEFSSKLKDAHGDVYDTVRRYNGGVKGRPSMKAAQAYATRVMKRRGKIFKRPWHRGEHQARGC